MDEVAIRLRRASFPVDLQAVATLDSTFRATERLGVERGEDGFRLVLEVLDTPVLKSFASEDINQRWDVALIAEIDERTVGFAAAVFQSWNRRLQVSHFYVDRAARRKGIGTALMDATIGHGARMAADHVWIETSNFNVPAIAAYRHWGYEFCGLDTSLYGGTPARGEVAIFLSRALHPLSR